METCALQEVLLMVQQVELNTQPLAGPLSSLEVMEELSLGTRHKVLLSDLAT